MRTRISSEALTFVVTLLLYEAQARYPLNINCIWRRCGLDSERPHKWFARGNKRHLKALLLWLDLVCSVTAHPGICFPSLKWSALTLTTTSNAWIKQDSVLTKIPFNPFVSSFLHYISPRLECEESPLKLAEAWARMDVEMKEVTPSVWAQPCRTPRFTKALKRHQAAARTQRWSPERPSNNTGASLTSVLATSATC